MILAILFIFLIVFFEVWLLFYLSKKMSNTKLGLFVGLLHLVLVFLIGIIMLHGLRYNKVPILQWNTINILDFPVILLWVSTGFVTSPLTDLPGEISVFYLPFFIFTVFGSLQYFFIGVGISQLIKRFKKNK